VSTYCLACPLNKGICYILYSSKVINLENLVRELRAFTDGGQKPEEGGKHGMIIPPGE